MNIFTKAITIASLATISTFATAGPIDLGATDGYTMLAVGTPWTGRSGGFLQLGSEAEIFGNVGARGDLQLAAGAKIHGNADGGHITIGAGASINGNQTTLSEPTWQGLYNDIANASNIAAAMNGLNYSSITETTTFQAYDTTSVFNIDGELNLASGESLTLSGDADSMAVVNISSGFMLGSGASIFLEGFEADNVVFNFTGGGHVDYVAFGGSELSGTFIGADMFFQMGDGATLNNTRFLMGGSIANVQVVKPGEPVVPPTGVPAPASVWLMLMGLIGMALIRRKA
ncbi:hypothetical protein CW745_03760 [Psychromonas sp. psych-6C06]|uniref:VPLPA-CTERM sorting domain-containing protein n=1 Tax=Psychromonas sp. psych-6C06 TaxID=2058089 RepID=UPI000C32CC4F|nr:VPLPA-CTERM sorting domain-containing protein [Psychromonas sp. psych-6C06]PKF62552.1 hypothetical protein CW745_03760 [Psychromonas sp. psych-6C06]